MSSAFGTETVLDVRHWTDDYFSFTTTRDDGFRFENGQFVMIGLQVANEAGVVKPLLRAYSIASANWEEQLEFFSIKVPNGPLTSRLKSIQPGDSVLIGRKPTGTLLLHDLLPGRNLYLLGTGTGFAPWLSVIKDPETYERFENVVLCHGVRSAQDLAYRDYIVNELPQHEFLGEQIAAKLKYYPAVTREDFVFEGRDQRGRLTEMMDSGRMTEQLGLPPLDAELDRAMICGSPQMLADFRDILDRRGFAAAPRIGTPGQYVFERAFVENKASRLRAGLTGLALAFACAGAAQAQAPAGAVAQPPRSAAAAPQLGELAPDFLGLDRAGRPVKVSDYRGKPVVVSFWAGWCAPCRRELPMLSTLLKSVGREHLQVIAVNLNEPKRDYEDFLRLNPSLELNFVHDAGSAARYYGVRSVPNLFVVDRDGRLVQIHRGYTPEKIEQFVRELAPLLPPQALRKPGG